MPQGWPAPVRATLNHGSRLSPSQPAGWEVTVSNLPSDLAAQRDESTLEFFVPEVASVVGPVRRRYIEAGDRTLPHITLFHPFLAAAETTPDVLHRVQRIASDTPVFDFAATGLATFATGVIYLTLEPVTPFVDLIARLRSAFPDVVPYWDEYGEVIPHISVALFTPATHDEVRAGVEAMLIEHLPLHCTADTIRLLQRLRPAPATWDERASFPLGDRLQHLP